MSDFNDIGISRELDWPRIKKLLTIGLFASVLHLAGDLILGFLPRHCWGFSAWCLRDLPASVFTA